MKQINDQQGLIAPPEQCILSPGDEAKVIKQQRSVSVRKAVPPVVTGQSWLAKHLPSLNRKLEVR